MYDQKLENAKAYALAAKDQDPPQTEPLSEERLRSGFVELVMEASNVSRNEAIMALRASEKTMDAKVKKDFMELTEEELNTIEQYILDIPIIGVYNDNDTPLDNFDSKCHDVKDGIKESKDNLQD